MGVRRKRRSFWEPESKRIKKWLDAQSNLGTSLQLIIVDAMRKYGDGDVISAHLMSIEDLPDGYTTCNSKQLKAEPTEENVLESTSENKIAVKTHKLKPSQELVVTKDTAEDIDGDPYDPIGIMLGDVGSKLNG